MTTKFVYFYRNPFFAVFLVAGRLLFSLEHLAQSVLHFAKQIPKHLNHFDLAASPCIQYEYRQR